PSPRHGGVVRAALGEPHDPVGLGDPLDDVADLQASHRRLVANDEVDGVSLGPHRRSPEARDHGRLVAARPLGAGQRDEADHGHEVLPRILAVHRALRDTASCSSRMSWPCTRAEFASSLDRTAARCPSNRMALTTTPPKKPATTRYAPIRHAPTI